MITVKTSVVSLSDEPILLLFNIYSATASHVYYRWFKLRVLMVLLNALAWYKVDHTQFTVAGL